MRPLELTDTRLDPAVAVNCGSNQFQGGHRFRMSTPGRYQDTGMAPLPVEKAEHDDNDINVAIDLALSFSGDGMFSPMTSHAKTAEGSLCMPFHVPRPAPVPLAAEAQVPTPTSGLNAKIAAVMQPKTNSLSKRRARTYFAAKPSKYCHICAQTRRKNQGVLVCMRNKEGRCRKMVCERCLRRFGYDYDTLKNNASEWLCPHCDDVCPKVSQCHIYNRINSKRQKVRSKWDAKKAAAGAKISGRRTSDNLNGLPGIQFKLPSTNGSLPVSRARLRDLA